MKRFGIAVLFAIVGYLVAAAASYFLVDLLSSNVHDRSVEAAMTSAFVFGPLGAVAAFIVGFVRGGRSAGERQMTPEGEPPFHLSRFVEAQARDYSVALGRTSRRQKADALDLVCIATTARARIQFDGQLSMALDRCRKPKPTWLIRSLGRRLRECVAAMNGLEGLSAEQVLGPVDAAKFRSCLTLFGVCRHRASPFSGGR